MARELLAMALSMDRVPNCARQSPPGLVTCALLCFITGACASQAGAPEAHKVADSGPSAKTPDSSVDAGRPPMSTSSMSGPAMNALGGMDGMNAGPPARCTSDVQCRTEVETALRTLSEAHAVRRRVVQATCTLNPCGGRRAHPVCGCVLAPDDRRPLEAYSLGSVGPCAVLGRGPTCLVRKDEYVACDTAVASSCKTQCEHAAEVLDSDDALARQIDVRYASCIADVGGTCMAVVRIDDACYFEGFSPASSDSQSSSGFSLPDQFTQRWDCSLTDAEIVSKYYPTTDWEALGCTVSPTTITCMGQSNGGCYLPLCLDPACYPDAGLDAGSGECSCSSEGFADFDAGSEQHL